MIPILFIKHYRYGGSGPINEYIKKGIKFIIYDKRIREIIIVGLSVNLILGMAAIMFISLIDVTLELPAIYVSIMFCMLVFGVSIGSLIGQRIKGSLGIISILLFIFIAISFLLISFSGSAILDILPIFFVGISIGMENVTINTALIGIIPLEMIARAQGAFNTFTVAATSASSIIGGVLYKYSVSYSFMILGIFMLIIAILIKFMRNFYNIVY